MRINFAQKLSFRFVGFSDQLYIIYLFLTFCCMSRSECIKNVNYLSDGLILMARSTLKALRLVLESSYIFQPRNASSTSIPLFDFVGSKMRILDCWVGKIDQNCGIFSTSRPCKLESERSSKDISKESKSSNAEFSLAEMMLW